MIAKKMDWFIANPNPNPKSSAHITLYVRTPFAVFITFYFSYFMILIECVLQHGGPLLHRLQCHDVRDGHFTALCWKFN